MPKHNLKLLYGKDELMCQINRVADEITKSYTDGKPLLCVCILRGAVMFFSELVKRLGNDVIMDFMTLSSYGEGAVSSGKVQLLNGLSENIKGKNILIVEDIIDAGFTVQFLRGYFKDRYETEVKIACLLDKPSARKVEAAADFTALTMKDDAFVVGFGLDLDQHYRNLEGIYEVVG